MDHNKNKHDYRDMIAGVNEKIPIANGKLTTAINFDNAATTPPFKVVLDAITDFSRHYSSIHRGTGYKSIFSSKVYEDSRKIVCDFIHCDHRKNTVIYVKNTTEAINKLSSIISNIYDDCVIISTRMEHHSNDLPWRNKFRVDYIDVDALGKLNISDLENKLKKYNGKVKLVCVTGASNVTGYKNPIYKIASLCHNYNAKILVDGAQLVPHYPIYMKSSHKDRCIDFLAFSAHKMYAPFGTGVLVGPKDFFSFAEPDHVGGGTIDIVTDDFVTWADPPDKNEAGTPNLMGVIALTTAIKTLNHLDMRKIDKKEMDIYYYALEQLKKIPGITIYCDTDNCDKVAILPFNIDGVYHEFTAKKLSEISGIAVRSGCFCAHPYIRRLLKIPAEEMEYYQKNRDINRPGMVRLSFSFYNTYEEVDALVKTLKKIIKHKSSFQ
ncbi:aminotransferase class V-fold PLP-dependent enzyme [Clostridiaceae bacterium UIB06]|uniref:Aminotransferase class V-fold PLP-dependent enzyme n=1 Tax=Clostridium thailandense TaxID=2794346 RepID=A0A949TKX7_9CLOT|nr:aminotransferase class V-fold PLP-dependent enzyme [Clostridium thailandense]MBV7274764.1 aminotransferase class V-fold PLP-dependent enzyme [Clostridium thailandense]MCH5137225.1 aminotransferase class V-fold PLP-dependent enzyme [Clostridiaceae bacterium UIB06]